jgi:type II secretory pathway component PulF
MIYTWEVTAITESERLVTRTIPATTREVAKRKMRRKFYRPIRSLQVHLAAFQEPQPLRLTPDLKALIKEKLAI